MPGTSAGQLRQQFNITTGDILECWFEGRPIRNEYLIVDGGKLAGTGAHSYNAGNPTRAALRMRRIKNKRLTALTFSEVELSRRMSLNQLRIDSLKYLAKQRPTESVTRPNASESARNEGSHFSD